ncbi:MAG: DUF1080 domain-containing protein [Verrucomicrobiota bacterium]|nr:DUF1080 domain-containing protein [Verrucomicrobiota bacterium]
MQNQLSLTIILFTLTSFPLFGGKHLFDGRTLDGWDGNPVHWSVKDGAIVGENTKENPTKGNTFLIWKDGVLKDFDLTLDYKIDGGNSGIQYRSFVKPGKHDGWRIGGYQADFESGDRFSGICYGEAFRGILSMRGDKTTLSLNDAGKLQKKVEKFGDTNEIGKAVKKGEWNNYRIVAKGFHFTQYINGVKTTELIDNDKKTRRADGLLAFQVHSGPPMKVYFKNIVLK